MSESWKEKLSCATQCHRCSTKLAKKTSASLGVRHEPICMPCKRAEEKRPDYEEVSKEAIGSCLADVEVAYGDPGGLLLPSFLPVHLLRPI